MPIYEYECSKCQQVFEFMQKFSDAPMSECPQESCKGELSKLLSLSSFSLKGSGWYATDYKKKTPPKSDEPKKPATEPAKKEKKVEAKTPAS